MAKCPIPWFKLISSELEYFTASLQSFLYLEVIYLSYRAANGLFENGMDSNRSHEITMHCVLLRIHCNFDNHVLIPRLVSETSRSRHASLNPTASSAVTRLRPCNGLYLRPCNSLYLTCRLGTRRVEIRAAFPAYKQLMSSGPTNSIRRPTATVREDTLQDT